MIFIFQLLLPFSILKNLSDGNSLLNFNINDQPSLKLFDSYWDFGTSVNKYKIARSTVQYKKLLFNKRQDSEVCRVQKQFYESLL